MDSEQQWRRLLDLIEGARERSAEANEAHQSAEAQLDVAEYELRQIADAIAEVLGPSALSAASPAPAPQDVVRLQKAS